LAQLQQWHETSGLATSLSARGGDVGSVDLEVLDTKRSTIGLAVGLTPVTDPPPPEPLSGAAVSWCLKAITAIDEALANAASP
jgi:hypothetical protein